MSGAKPLEEHAIEDAEAVATAASCPAPDEDGPAEGLAGDGIEGETTEEIPGMAEACRRFPMPDDEQAAHALRELSWGEHFVAGRMVASKGGSDLYLYSLKSAAVFLLDRDQAHIGKGSDQIIKLIDVDAFISWVRDTVGDVPLADALQEDCPADEPYHDRLGALQLLLALRMVQYGGL